MGIKFPTPWKTLIIKFPPPRDSKGVKCPGYARGGGHVEASIWPIHNAYGTEKRTTKIKRRAICFATLLTNALKSNVARFITYEPVLQQLGCCRLRKIVTESREEFYSLQHFQSAHVARFTGQGKLQFGSKWLTLAVCSVNYRVILSNQKSVFTQSLQQPDLLQNMFKHGW